MSLTRVKVESNGENFRVLLSRFRSAVKESGILQEYKERQYYESPSRKRRRKTREAESMKLKNELRKNFSRNGNYE